jgi:hypothetical protein
VEKSQWGSNYTPPTNRTDSVEHKDPQLKIRVKETTARGDIDATVTYFTDGRESTNVVMGNPLKAVVKWEGQTMFLHTWGDFGGREIVVDDRWSLSGDGRTLTVRRLFKSPERSAEQTIVYEKK